MRVDYHSLVRRPFTMGSNGNTSEWTRGDGFDIGDSRSKIYVSHAGSINADQGLLTSSSRRD